MIKRFEVFPNFFDRAEEMRGKLDSHFAQPYEQNELTHGIWNIWYTTQVDPDYRAHYFRAMPERLFGEDLVHGFMARLRGWARSTLGVSSVSPPSMHLYLNGSFQGLHSDYQNGVFGWVFSLTRWDERTFTGGETLLFRDGYLNYKRHQFHGEAIHEYIAPRFNQLTVFDDRIVHCVQRTEGTMDPRQARVVVHGHLFGGFPVVDGPLPEESARSVVWQGLPDLAGKLRPLRDAHGMISVRVPVSAEGVAGSPEILFNNIVSGQQKRESVDTATNEILAFVGRLRFPAAASASVVSIPILVPIPQLETVRFDLPHNLGLELARERIAKALLLLRFSSNLDGRWSETRMDIMSPGPGFIQIEKARVHGQIEFPMMLPNQIQALSAAITQRIESAISGGAT